MHNGVIKDSNPTNKTLWGSRDESVPLGMFGRGVASLTATENFVRAKKDLLICVCLCLITSITCTNPGRRLSTRENTSTPMNQNRAVMNPSPSPIQVATPSRVQEMKPPSVEAKPAEEDTQIVEKRTPEETPTAPSVGERKSRSVDSKFITGPRGGCYYLNSNGRKTYVPRTLCNS